MKQLDKFKSKKKIITIVMNIPTIDQDTVHFFLINNFITLELSQHFSVHKNREYR